MATKNFDVRKVWDQENSFFVVLSPATKTLLNQLSLNLKNDLSNQPGSSLYNLNQLGKLESVKNQLTVKEFLEKSFGEKNCQINGASNRNVDRVVLGWKICGMFLLFFIKLS